LTQLQEAQLQRDAHEAELCAKLAAHAQRQQSLALLHHHRARRLALEQRSGLVSCATGGVMPEARTS